MTELEILQRAKMYMDKLAAGIDPISNLPVPEGEALMNPRLSKCFGYVSGVLQRVIDNGGNVGSAERTMEFSLTPEQFMSIRIPTEPIRMIDFLDLLYRAADNPDMKRPSAKRFSDWLLGKGYLRIVTDQEGKQRRVPTQSGLEVGLVARTGQGRIGTYTAVYYEPRAVELLLTHWGEIVGTK